MNDARQLIAMVWLALDFWTLAVVAIFTLFCVVLYRINKSRDNTFAFHDLFSSGDWSGKASVTRLGYFGAFLTHSLIVLHMQMKTGGASTEMMSMYALIWSGAYVLAKFVDQRAATPPSPPKGDTNAVPQ